MDQSSGLSSRTQAAAGDWTRLVGGFTALPRLLAGRGVTPAGVLREVGLAPDALCSADRRIRFSASAALLHDSVQATRCAHFALLAGRETRLVDLGAVGHLTRSAATVGAALRGFAAHHRHISTGGSVFLHEHGSSVSWGHVVFHPGVDRMGPAHDFAMAAGVSLMRELCGPEWNPGEVVLPYRRPADVRPYEDFFRCPLRFDAEHCAIRFPAWLMERPLSLHGGPSSSPAAPQAADGDEDLAAEIYRSTRLLLLRGESQGAQVAQALGLQRRTLARHLQAQGLSFKRVLEEVRYAVARELLAETEMPVVDIALTLGYAEASPFVRAFRRWSGCAPLPWRNARRTGEPAGSYAVPAAAGPLRRA